MAAQNIEMNPERAVNLDVRKIQYFAEVMRKSRDALASRKEVA